VQVDRKRGKPTNEAVLRVKAAVAKRKKEKEEREAREREGR
jgi:hypothetical protein